MDSDDDEPPVLVDLTQQQSLPGAPAADNGEEEEDEELPPCPVTILSGFLGSGKTTLIQHILGSPDHGKRIAVIENEFGEGLAVESLIARDGIDPERSSLQDFIELPNGCICCTVKDTLVETLESLLAKRRDLDYILIEASGMANPGPIASVFWLDEALESRLRLDGIITLVDAKSILQQLASTEEAAQQVAYADRLLVNKADLVSSPEDLDRIKGVLRGLHPTAPMRTTTYSKVPDLDWILQADCFGGSTRLEELDAFWNEPQHDDHGHHDHDHDHHHDHHHDHDHDDHHDCEECHEHQTQQQPQEQHKHKHTEAITTLGFSAPGSVSLKKLNAWLADVLWPNQDETNEVLMGILEDTEKKEAFWHAQQQSDQPKIFRVKGIVSVVHNDDDDDSLEASEKDAHTVPLEGGGVLDHRRYIVQGVHDLWEVYPASDGLRFEAEEERVSKLVVIGKHLPKDALDAGFRSCFVHS